MKFLKMFAASLLFVFAASAQVKEDGALKKWSDRFYGAQFDQLQSDLASHIQDGKGLSPYAIQAWLFVEKRNKNTTGDFNKFPQAIQKTILFYKAADSLTYLSQTYKLYELWRNLIDKRWLSPMLGYLIHDGILDVDGMQLYDEYRAELDRGQLPFQCLRNISSVLEDNMAARTKMQEEMSKLKQLVPSSLYPYLDCISDSLQRNSYGYLFSIKKIKNFANDDAALRAFATELFNVEQYDSAIYYYTKSARINPFRESVFTSIAESYLRMSKFEAFDQALKLWVKLYPTNDLQYQLVKMKVYLLYKCGFYGRAEDLLESVANVYNDDGYLNYIRGQLENKFEHKENSFKCFEKATKAYPSAFFISNAYVDMLRSYKKDYKKALTFIEDISSRYQFLNQDLIVKRFEVLGDQGNFDSSVNVLKEGLRYFPESRYIMNVLAQAYYTKLKRPAEALAWLERSVKLSGPYNFTFYLYKQLQDSLDSKMSLDKLKSMADRYYWFPAAHGHVIEKLRTNELKLSYWQSVMNNHKDIFFPIEEIIGLYMEDEKYDKCLELLEKTKASSDTQINPSYYSNYLFRRAHMAVAKLRTRSITSDEIDSSFFYFNRYLSNYGRPGAYYQYTAELYAARGEKKQAAATYGKLLECRPGTSKYVSAINSKYLGEYGNAQASGKAHEYFKTNPYSQSVINDLLWMYSMWNVAPINVLYYAAWAKENGLKYDETQVGMAYGHLGDNAKYYNLGYSRKESIGSSFRYIGWFNSARAKIYEGNVEVVYNYPSDSVILKYDDGNVLVRKDDRVSGKVKELRMGKTFIKCKYDDNGNLLEIYNSAGERVFMKYELDKITNIRDWKGNDIRITYTQNGQPDTLFQKGVGYIQTSYLDDGEVKEVKAKSFDGKSDRSVSLSVTNCFQNLLNVIRKMSEVLETTHSIPNLGMVDSALNVLTSNSFEIEQKLEYNRKDPSTERKYLQTFLHLVEYYVNNQKNNYDYLQRASTTLMELFNRFKTNSVYRIDVISIIEKFYQLKLQTKVYGIDSKDWQTIIGMREWMESEKMKEKTLSPLRLKIESVQNFVLNNPIGLIKTSEWLPKSDLNITGFWKKFNSAEIVTDKQFAKFTRFKTLDYIDNGQLLLGSSHGMYILRKGYWEFFAYNEKEDAVVRDIKSENFTALSEVNAFSSFLDSLVILGTGDGIIIVKNELGGKPVKKINNIDGRPIKRVAFIKQLGNRTFIGTENQVFYLDSLLEIHRLENFVEGITFFKKLEVGISHDDVGQNGGNDIFRHLLSDEKGNGLFIGSTRFLYAVQKDLTLKKIIQQPLQDISIDKAGSLYFLIDKELHKYYYQDSIESIIKVQANITTTNAKEINGLAKLPVRQDGDAIAILTDLGVDLYYENYLQHFYLPLDNGLKQAALQVATHDRSFAIETSQGILIFNRNIVEYKNTRIKDMLTLDSLNYTLMISDGQIKLISNTDPSNYSSYINFAADKLSRHTKNSIITNDGLDVYLISLSGNANDIERKKLFECNQTLPKDADLKQENITSILTDSKGNVWVTAGPSLFYCELLADSVKSVKEFSFFKDAKEFDSRTYSLQNVFESNDGNIYVVGSDERHLYYKGLAYSGGLMKFDRSAGIFERIRFPSRGEDFFWFITSYTKIDEDKAIVGSVGGFQEDNNGLIKSLSLKEQKSASSSSYKKINKTFPALFFGTKGVKVGNIWLFGSASGIICYNNGVWFYPQGLNQLLPKDLDYGNYGGRQVNVLETDTYGNLYVATDLGYVLIKNSGNDLAYLLDDDTNGSELIEYENEEILSKEKRLLLNGLQKSSPLNSIIADLEDAKKSMAHFVYLKEADQKFTLSAPTGNINKDSLNSLIEQQQARYAGLILKLQNNDPGVYQTLEIKPMDLLEFRKNLSENECVIQYIPYQKRLFILLIAKGQIIKKEVEIDRKVLLDSCSALNLLLANKEISQTSSALRKLINSKTPTDKKRVFELECFLYDILLRPMRNELMEYKAVYIIPTNNLNNIPFAALVDKKSETNYSFAIEDFNIGYLTSLYLDLLAKNLVMSTQPVYNVFANPDGTLPYAEKEGETVSKLLPSAKYFKGSKVNFANLKSSFIDCKVLHLATHGHLEKDDIAGSWLMLADGQKLTMDGIYSLPFGTVDLMVLSACETGLCIDGLELATLARSFSNRGVKCIIATLWKVDDEATQLIMADFYKNLLAGENKVVSLKKAQMNLIKSNSKYQDPYYWAGFSLIGRN